MERDFELLALCHHCDLKVWDKENYRLICSISKENLIDHARKADCPLGFYDATLLKEDSPIEFVLKFLPSKGPKPSGWHEWENVKQAYQTAVCRFISNLEEFPEEKYSGRGIVIAAGGDYAPSAMVIVQLLRSFGYEGPIVWAYLPGEMPSWQKKIIEPFNITFLQGPKTGGWELKTWAILNAGFEEVIFLDADCEPVKDPSFLFESEIYNKFGAVFWPDKHWHESGLGKDLSEAVWGVVGLEPRSEPAFETGQLIINLKRCWKALKLADWMSREHGRQFYYKWVYGDKDCFHLAWRLCGLDYGMLAFRWGNGYKAMIQYDPTHTDKPTELFWHLSAGKRMINFGIGRKVPWNARTNGGNQYLAKGINPPHNVLAQELLSWVEKEWHKNRPSIHIGTVCINYEDYLTATVDMNKTLAESWTVITEEEDKVVSLCRHQGLREVYSNRVHAHGSKFNLGALRNDLYASIAEIDPDCWILSLDADCRLPDNFREILDQIELDKTCIYGAKRTGHVLNENDNAMSGFFQMFHASVVKDKKYREDWKDAGNTDIFFVNLWPPEKRITIPGVTLTHLGVPALDWEGRVSERYDPNRPLNIPTAQEIWFSIHSRPAKVKDLSKETYWLLKQTDPLPCGECKTEWPAYLKANPPWLWDRESYARWGWQAHNAVRVRKGQEPHPWTEACKTHGWPESLYVGRKLLTDRIAIFGLQRSGTNFAASQMKLNYNVDSFPENFPNYWKHGPFIKEAFPWNTSFVLCVRHPFQHLIGFYRYALRDCKIDRTLHKQFDPSLSFEGFLKTPCYEFENPVVRWSQMHKAWLESLPMECTAILRLETEDQRWSYDYAGSKLNLPKYNDDLILERVDVNDSRPGTPITKYSQALFTPDLLEFVRSQLDERLVAFLGYQL